MDIPRSLTVLALLREEALEDARAAARAWDEAPVSPFAALPGIHLGRVVVVERMERHVKKAFEEGSFLLLSIDHDGELDGLVDAMVARIPGELDALLGWCDGWPGTADRDAVLRWISDRRVKRGVELIAYPKATVQRVKEAIDVHERVVRFACRAQDLDPLAVRDAFFEAFPEHAP